MGWVTRGEFTMLEREVRQTRRELGAFRKEHLAQHEAELEQRQAEAASRAAGRRWAIGTGLVAIGSLWAPLLYLIVHLR